jgi:hypothetical protein
MNFRKLVVLSAITIIFSACATVPPPPISDVSTYGQMSCQDMQLELRQIQARSNYYNNLAEKEKSDNDMFSFATALVVGLGTATGGNEQSNAALLDQSKNMGQFTNATSDQYTNEKKNLSERESIVKKILSAKGC